MNSSGMNNPFGCPQVVPLSKISVSELLTFYEHTLIQSEMCPPEQRPLVEDRFWIVAITGTTFALFGLLANGLLATLFLTRNNYRHSPFFFLGFVALFDTLLDATYILLLESYFVRLKLEHASFSHYCLEVVPVNAEYFLNYKLYLMWLNYMPPLFILGQIFKISSVVCLIVASVERYCLTKHWTFTGFQYRTRWIVLVFAIFLSIVVKLLTSRIEIQEISECTGFGRFRVGTRRDNAYMMSLVNALVIFVPFFTLVFLNGGIVMMLRKQNVQQLRSLITELTMGHDVMKIRRRNLRSATNTLLVIITAYLISNVLNLFLTLTEYFDADFLHIYHPDFYRLAADWSSLLTVIGNAIRCPAHFVSNKEIRQQFALMFFGEETEKEVKVASLKPLMLTRSSTTRRYSEKVAESPWISLLLTVHDKNTINTPMLSDRMMAKRHSAIAIC